MSEERKFERPAPWRKIRSVTNPKVALNIYRREWSGKTFTTFEFVEAFQNKEGEDKEIPRISTFNLGAVYELLRRGEDAMIVASPDALQQMAAGERQLQPSGKPAPALGGPVSFDDDDIPF